MLKTNVGYSILNDSYQNGVETATKAKNGLNNPKVTLLFSSVLCEQEKLIEGVKSVVGPVPIVGCTSSSAIMVPDGIITAETGYSGAMMLDDNDLKIGVAGMEKDGDARKTGRKIALEAIKNSGTDVRPSYFYMVANPAEEESYLKGIQDIIGRVPMFGGSAADDTVEGKWKIFCNDKVFSEGCAVVFFYTDRKFVTEYTGAYNETSKMGIITKVSNKRRLEEIDGVPALKKYAEWRGLNPNELKEMALLSATITNPLGVKDPIGSLTVIRHPMVGNNDYSMNIGNDLEEGTAVIMMSATVDQLIASTSYAVKEVNSKLENNIGGYFLVHCGGRKLGIGDRMNEVHSAVKEACGDTPFLMIFTFGEYGYRSHSANTCGGLMLSFTGFEK